MSNREPQMILLWNGGSPFVIDGRHRHLEIHMVHGDLTKENLLAWAAANDVRCVGFAGDACAPRGNATQKRENTWAAE